MDYKAMWEALREQLESDHAYYADGRFCSMMEAVHGEGFTANLLHTMDKLEDKYKED